MKFLAELNRLNEEKKKTIEIFFYSGFWHYIDPKTGDVEPIEGNKAALMKEVRAKFGDVNTKDVTDPSMNEAATAEQQDALADLIKKSKGFKLLKVDDHNEGDNVTFMYMGNKYAATLHKNGKWSVGIFAGLSFPHINVDDDLKTPKSVVDSVVQWDKDNDTELSESAEEKLTRKKIADEFAKLWKEIQNRKGSVKLKAQYDKWLGEFDYGHAAHKSGVHGGLDRRENARDMLKDVLEDMHMLAGSGRD